VRKLEDRKVRSGIVSIWDLEFGISDLKTKYEEIATLEEILSVGAASSREIK